MNVLARQEALVPVGGDPIALCRQSIATHSKSFALASRLLPAECRDSAVVLYAWCRRADDAIDLAPAPHQAAAVARLSAELDEVYGGPGRPVDPIVTAFQEVVHACRVPRVYPDELLAGMRMDVEGATYRRLDDLLLYCHRVAGVVGLMMCHLMRLRDDAALRNAAHLGIAMQLTNICRDVHEDWARGRLYLPDEILAAHGAAGLRDLLGGPFPAEARRPVAAVVRDLLGQADAYYRSGDRGLRALPWRAALGVRAARLVYAAIGGRLAQLRFDPLAGRAVVSHRRKLGLVLRAGLGALAEAPARALRALRAPPLAVPRALVRYPDDVLPL